MDPCRQNAEWASPNLRGILVVTGTRYQVALTHVTGLVRRLARSIGRIIYVPEKRTRKCGIEKLHRFNISRDPLNERRVEWGTRHFNSLTQPQLSWQD